MTVKFMTQEWVEAISTAVAASEEMTQAIGQNSLSIQFSVTDVPHTEDGSYQYYLEAKPGIVNLKAGEHENADATITQNYDTAAAIFRGELNAQSAFISGKIKIGGNMAKIMQHQNTFTAFANAVEGLAVEF